MTLPNLSELWTAYKNFAIVFSFLVNFVLVIVLLLVLQLLLPITSGIVEPLVDGLHGNFVAMDQATIRATIPVSANVPIAFPLPIENTRASVVIAEPVPLNTQPYSRFPAQVGRSTGW